MSGLHVAVEGLDGSGKSTLISNVSELLADDFDVRSFRLPDSSSLGGGDLADVVTKRRPSPSPEALALAFAANRTDSYQRLVLPYLDGDPSRIALWDRYVLSGLAYQGMQGVPLPWLLSLNEQVEAPDLTVFLDTDPAECAARIRRRKGGPELFEVRFAEVRAAFLLAIDALRDQGWEVYVMDGSAEEAVLAKEVAALLRRSAAQR
jgi:dTMP kinase